MLQSYVAHNFVDAEGNPAGGYADARGISIRWQKGPLGRPPARVEPNGAFVETVIAIARDRIQFYQDSRFACSENAAAMMYLELALNVLQSRTARREAAGIEGTHVEDS